MTALNTTNAGIRYINASAVASRAAELIAPWNSAAITGEWYKNCMNGASNAGGLGIGTQTNLASGIHVSWTLADQFAVARTAAALNQKSQCIGGAGYTALPTAPFWSSGGVAGNAAQASTLLISVINPINNANLTPNTAAAPTLNNGGTGTATVEMLSLAAGWTAVGL